MLRLIPFGIELAGFALIGLCVYLIEPRLLLGLGGLAVLGIGNALNSALEKAE